MVLMQRTTQFIKCCPGGFSYAIQKKFTA